MVEGTNEVVLVKEQAPEAKLPEIDTAHLTPQDLRNSVTRRTFLNKIKDLAFPAIIASNFSTLSPLGAVVRGSVNSLLTGSRSESATDLLRTYEPGTVVPVQGKQVQHIGVAHAPESYRIHKEDIVDRIEQAPGFIFLEYFDDRSIHNALPSSPEPEEETTIVNMGSQIGAYFSAMGRAAAIAGKDIVVVNSDTQFLQVSEVPVLSLTAAVLANDVNSLKKTNEGSKDITRRSFLGLAGKTAARAAVYAVGGPVLLRQVTGIDATQRLQKELQAQGILTNDLTEDEQANILAWSYVDYRNLCSAIGVEAAIKKYGSEMQPDSTVPIFEGADHSGMLNYLVDPKLRDAKEVAYKPLNIASDRTVKRYHFDKENNRWELADRFKY